MASEEIRTRDGRARAEEALVRLAIHAGTAIRQIVIIGGLNPDFLAPMAPAPHVGTTDVDILVEVGFVFDRDDLDFAWLEHSLNHMGGVAKGSEWRWVVAVDTVPVKIELLCDVHDSQGQAVALPGTSGLSAMNLTGPAPARRDSVARRLRVPDHVRRDVPGAPASVTLRFASLGGYLLAKASAMVGRSAAKDEYDFMYVVLYNDAGPRGAFVAIAASLSPSAGSAHLSAALRRFTSEYAPAAGSFARQMIDSSSVEEYDVLREDAITAASYIESRLAGS